MSNFETKVYPFTTEDISHYFNHLDLNNKSVLTVGSSGDQAFNALLLGAKDVTIYDINSDTKKFVERKKDIILNSNYKQAYYNILRDKTVNYSEDIFSFNALKYVSNYFHDEESYKLLQSRLANHNINYLTGNIFDFYEADKSYDRIILSNVLDYIRLYLTDNTVGDFIYNSFMKWNNHLNEDGIIQLFYVYCREVSMPELYDLVHALEGYILEIIDFPNSSNPCMKSSIVTYTKRK